MQFRQVSKKGPLLAFNIGRSGGVRYVGGRGGGFEEDNGFRGGVSKGNIFING